MHPNITRAAYEQLPAGIQQVFQPYLDDILWASMVPDIFIREWENHEWNIHREPGDKTAAPTRIEALSQDILQDLRRKPADIEFVKNVQISCTQSFIINHELYKLHFAIHGNTAAELIMQQADSNQTNMGLTSWERHLMARL